MTDIAKSLADGAAMEGRAAAAVYFDGGCPLCSREIATYRAMTGAEDMAWIDVNDPANAARLPEGTTREALLARFTVRRQDGALADGAAGFVALWRGLDRTRGIARVLDRQPFLAIAEGAYRLFLRLRPLWRR